MTRFAAETGTSLIEALVATTLLVVLAGGLAQLLAGSRRLSVLAERADAATRAAQDRLEETRAAIWTFDTGGAPVDAPEVAISPPGSLARNLPGYWDAIDARGRRVGLPGTGAVTFVRRWAVAVAGSGDPDARAIEVCVLDPPAPPAATPIVCLATIRIRQP
jgi:type II secretory pathway pseudopilin PulG